ncbi:MAG: Crp/Fnr family transcriptional regulator [Alphaproteobacteria bacterium]|nr:Crp/Fnr family transcriptional regulator [Alphaproteobacteria bacterium]
MISAAQKIHATASLNRSRWFASQPESLKQALLARAQTSEIAAGQWIYGSGDELNGLYGVISGSVHLLVTASGQETRLLEIVPAGQFFGQAARFGGGPRLVTAIAGERSTLFFVPHQALREIAATQPDVWPNFTELLYGQLAAALILASLALSLPPRLRVAARLAVLASWFGSTGKKETQLSVTQSQLGEMTGLSRKTVNTHLRTLEDSGIIACDYARIVVRDYRRLRAKSGMEFLL